MSAILTENGTDLEKRVDALISPSGHLEVLSRAEVNNLLDTSKGRTDLPTVDLYFGCVTLLETFSQDNIIVLAK